MSNRFDLGKADLQVLLATVLAGSGWFFSINALKELPPLFFIGSRFLLAGLLIGLFSKLPSVRFERGEFGFTMNFSHYLI